MCNILKSIKYVLMIDAFANKSTLVFSFFKIYRDKDIYIINNKY
jgi:hypothetical protein